MLALIGGSWVSVYVASVLILGGSPPEGFHLTGTAVALASAVLSFIGAIIAAIVTTRRQRKNESELVGFLREENAYLKDQLERKEAE